MRDFARRGKSVKVESRLGLNQGIVYFFVANFLNLNTSNNINVNEAKVIFHKMLIQLPV
jgi:hypothetical protein